MSGRAGAARSGDDGSGPAADVRREFVWLGMAALTIAGALSAVLECTLVPLYAGTVVVPIAVLLALVLNVVLPLLGREIVPRTLAAAAPFLAWLVVVLAFGAVARPEGDVILPGGGAGHVVWVTYGVLLGGALAGAVTLVVVSSPRAVNR